MLVAQDLASYGKDRPDELGAGVDRPAGATPSPTRADWVRLLYLYPSDLTDELIDAICSTPACRTSTSRCSTSASRCCAGCAGGATATGSCAGSSDIRAREPDAAFRSNFIVGYPGETEADHDQLLALRRGGPARLVRLLLLQPEDGTYAAGLDGAVDPALMGERLAELRELQDGITARRRDALIGRTCGCSSTSRASAAATARRPRSTASSRCPTTWRSASSHDVTIVDAMGPDLVAADAAPAEVALMPVDPTAHRHVGQPGHRRRGC